MSNELGEQFKDIAKKAILMGLTGNELLKIESIGCLKKSDPSTCRSLWNKFIFCVGTVCLCLGVAIIVICVTEKPVTVKELTDYYFQYHNSDIERDPCLIPVTEFFHDVTRPPVDCSVCVDVKNIDRVTGLTPELFEEKYAYTGRPVVIEDGATNWTAPEHFSFTFFKSLYKEDSPALENVESNCQFFPYKTNFESLGEVFDMSEERAAMRDGSEPWYIGWSNCDYAAANVLRQHYTRPYFLPEVAESSKTDWIFMGSPGYGAHLHIDSVGLPSWQAQITGTKVWTLEPPPECYSQCTERLSTTIHPGEIIVLNTNQWFHSTLIIGEDMSITIGSEFD